MHLFNMKRKILNFGFMSVLALSLFTNAKCSDDDESRSSCGSAAVIAPGFFETAESENFDFINVEILDNCLNVEILAIGCDGNNWSLVLVDSGRITETDPTRRNLKLVFSNEESCETLITQSRNFDLQNLRMEGSETIELKIEGLDDSLIYNY